MKNIQPFAHSLWFRVENKVYKNTHIYIKHIPSPFKQVYKLPGNNKLTKTSAIYIDVSRIEDTTYLGVKIGAHILEHYSNSSEGFDNGYRKSG